MTPVVYGGATALLAACALAYFRGHFGAAGLLGLGSEGALGFVLARTMSPASAAVTLALLCVVPLALLGLHVIDARRGLFLLPTIYSIPLAFFAAALLWIVAGGALLLAS